MPSRFWWGRSGRGVDAVNAPSVTANTYEVEGFANRKERWSNFETETFTFIATPRRLRTPPLASLQVPPSTPAHGGHWQRPRQWQRWPSSEILCHCDWLHTQTSIILRVVSKPTTCHSSVTVQANCYGRKLPDPLTHAVISGCSPSLIVSRPIHPLILAADFRL